MERLELVDSNHPELGYKLRHPNRNRFIPEYEAKLGHMSVTDGVFIPTGVPLSAPEASPDTVSEPEEDS